MIKHWSIDLNDDGETYKLCIENNDVTLNLTNVHIKFLDEYNPHIQGSDPMAILPDSKSWWVMRVPESNETGIS